MPIIVRIADRPHIGMSARIAACQDVVVVDRRNGQSYCDWCYGQLTTDSIHESEKLGLDAEYSWCCEACLASRAYQLPPEGWEGTRSEWPYINA
jgi:hypothetical protein